MYDGYLQQSKKQNIALVTHGSNIGAVLSKFKPAPIQGRPPAQARGHCEGFSGRDAQYHGNRPIAPQRAPQRAKRRHNEASGPRPSLTDAEIP